MCQLHHSTAARIFCPDPILTWSSAYFGSRGNRASPTPLKTPRTSHTAVFRIIAYFSFPAAATYNKDVRVTGPRSNCILRSSGVYVRVASRNIINMVNHTQLKRLFEEIAGFPQSKPITLPWGLGPMTFSDLSRVARTKKSKNNTTRVFDRPSTVVGT